MKTISFLILLLTLTFVSGYAQKSNTFYVSPSGNDNNPGTIEKPFQTLQVARNALRASTVSGSKTVILRGGIYSLAETLVLEPQDSETNYKAFPGETPIVTGGRAIKNWKRLKEKLPEIADEAKGELWYADVPKDWLFHYMYVNGQRAERSKSTDATWREWPNEFTPGEPEKQGQLITFKDNSDLKYLPTNGDAEMVSIQRQYGVMANGVVRDVNYEASTIRWHSKQLNVNTYGREGHRVKEHRYRFDNALCFIKKPGEWAVNSELGRVYYYPKEGEQMTSAEVVAPKLYELVRLQGEGEDGALVSRVEFHGITFAYTDRLPEDKWPSDWLFRQWENVDAMLFFEATERCVVKDCRLLHCGAYGITMRLYAQHNRIEGSEIGWTGSGGIFLEGYGPGLLDLNKNNHILRNHIHDHGLGNYWHSPSIQVYQSGHNRIAYNLMQRSAYSSISITSMKPDYMNAKRFAVPGHWEGQYNRWNVYRMRFTDFPEYIQDDILADKKYFDRKTFKAYTYTNGNLVEYNVISEPHSKLNEGGAIYAYSIGKENIWSNNAIFKSRAMPGSSILALDNVCEYTTIKDNVFWINGKILDGVGARSNERGNIINGNVRANYKKEFISRRGHDKIGEGKWWVNDTGRSALDKLIKEITVDVEFQGGWIGNPKIGIPELGEEITKYGELLILPKGAHVTIEE